jgi:methylglutaconyl-CoA hydratase
MNHDTTAMHAGTAPRLRSAKADGLGVITLARPDAQNALDRQAVTELVATLREFEHDATVRVVIVEGDGDDFCIGADIPSLGTSLDEGVEVHLDDARSLGQVFTRLRELPKPTVAIVRGRALGTGAGLATACDIVLAEESAQFGYPDIRFGAVPAMATAALRRAVGEKRAAELVLTGRIITAAEAAQIGLISRAIPTATFPQEVARTLELLVNAPSVAIGLTKRLLYRLDGLDFAEGIGVGAAINVESRASDDFRSGVRRILERRRKS